MDHTYNQLTARPTAKVTAVGAAGLIISTTVTVLALFGVIVPEGLSEQATQAVAATITLITFVQAAVQFAAGYFKKSTTR